MSVAIKYVSSTIDSYVSYTALHCTGMLQYTVMIRKLGRDRCGKRIGEKPRESAMKHHDGTNMPPMITAASHVTSGLMLPPVASAHPKLTNPGAATWPNHDGQHNPGATFSSMIRGGDLRQIPSIPHPTPNTAAPANNRASTFPFFCTRTDPTR